LRDWAAPKHYSIVDAYLLAFWFWGIRIELNMGNYPAWAAPTERTIGRPAVQRSLE
jgi:glutathione S-transferase